jgi:hypothetical protein
LEHGIEKMHIFCANDVYIQINQNVYLNANKALNKIATGVELNQSDYLHEL